MKAAFKRGRDVFIRETPLPKPGSGQLRLAVQACGICGTDLHDAPADADAAVPFGHEVAGRVTELGEGVSGPAVGTQVVLDSSTPAGAASSAAMPGRSCAAVWRASSTSGRSALPRK
jgi:threonine dehydrogenase-like Zn-dependent dehydrogenase